LARTSKEQTKHSDKSSFASSGNLGRKQGRESRRIVVQQVSAVAPVRGTHDESRRRLKGFQEYAMNLTEEAKLLKRVPIFSKVDPARLRLLALASERIVFAAGQEVCHQGDKADTMYVILEGEAEVLIDRKGGQIAVAELRKNSFFGETAILCDVLRTATIKAREPLSTLRVSKDMFYHLVTDCPEMAVEVMRVLANRLEHTKTTVPTTTATGVGRSAPEYATTDEIIGNGDFPTLYTPEMPCSKCPTFVYRSKWPTPVPDQSTSRPASPKAKEAVAEAPLLSVSANSAEGKNQDRVTLRSGDGGL
jgi:CRP/FNR family transcriptional regulator, cyclic AMP receptor protein